MKRVRQPSKSWVEKKLENPSFRRVVEREYKTLFRQKRFKGVLDLDYVEARNVPVEKSGRFGDVMSADVSGRIERMVARAILDNGIPIRGLELGFLRQVLGMSHRELGELLGSGSGAVSRWERAKRKRLKRVNEIAVRVLMADRYGLKISADWDCLVGLQETQKKMVVDFKTYEREIKRTA